MTSLKKPVEEMQYILATDVGSTTTKARFFKKIGNEWRYVTSGEAPTTVETPYEDVTAGVRNAVREVEELTGHHLLSAEGDESGILLPYNEGVGGVDLYCTTSSAGGGLQMMTAGVVMSMTTESASKAALGAGAIVMDAMSIDDERPTHQKIERIRNLRPDMMLIAGGTDGGTISHIMQIVELIRAAAPKARLGASYELPLVFAGNKYAAPQVEQLLKDLFALKIVPNLRPTLERENTEPARQEIHELFMEHVMSHAPGYDKLMKWTEIDIMPTPAGEGLAMQTIANMYQTNVLGVGLGGATTNVYSVYRDEEWDESKFIRSVSANLGMSYSICNVLKEATLPNIMRWLPFDIDDAEVRNKLRNKMIRPTTIPQTLKELLIEHAVAREALRLGLTHHRSLATRLKGARKGGSFDGIFTQDARVFTYIQMMNIGIICGTGGLLSHAPRRQQPLLLLTDAFQPEGVTRIFQDSVFMMPHLGVLSTVFEQAAKQIFEKDCLIRLGTVIAPAGSITEGESAIEVRLELPEGPITETVKFGEIKRIQLEEGMDVHATLRPYGKLDVGGGRGHRVETTVYGGKVGVVIDARGRPLDIPVDFNKQKQALLKWFTALELYDSTALEQLEERV